MGILFSLVLIVKLSFILMIVKLVLKNSYVLEMKTKILRTLTTPHCDAILAFISTVQLCLLILARTVI